MLDNMRSQRSCNGRNQGTNARACFRASQHGAVRRSHRLTVQAFQVAQAQQQKESSNNSTPTPEKKATAPSPLPLAGPATLARGTTLALILGGGTSDQRLFPLTDNRALPAVPVGGSFRLIDFPMTSLIDSGVNKIYVLTQFNSQSLNKHVTRTYNLSSGIPYGGDGNVEIIAASQYPNSKPSWAIGTADAVRNMSWLFAENNTKNRLIEDVMVLPADQLYRIDFTALLAQHRMSAADITILCQPCESKDARRFGIVKLDPDSSGVTAYVEKPISRQVLSTLRMPKGSIETLVDNAAAAEHAAGCFDNLPPRRTSAGVGSGSFSSVGSGTSLGSGSGSEGDAQLPDYDKKRYLASTGIYVFRRSVLTSLLERYPSAHNFGSELLPLALAEAGGMSAAMASMSMASMSLASMDGSMPVQGAGGAPLRVMGYVHAGSWADVGGSIGDFHAAHMSMLNDAPFDPMRYSATLFQAPEALPPTMNRGARVVNSLISAACILGEGAIIRSSIIGKRSVIGDKCDLSEVVFMGADYFEGERMPKAQEKMKDALPALGVGSGTIIQRAVVDKGARIGKNCVITNRAGVHESYDRMAQGVCIRDGIVCITKSAILPDGTEV